MAAMTSSIFMGSMIWQAISRMRQLLTPLLKERTSAYVSAREGSRQFRM